MCTLTLISFLIVLELGAQTHTHLSKIILFLIHFQKFRFSKHVTFLHFTNHSWWKCKNTFKNVILNAFIYKMVKTLQIDSFCPKLTYFILSTTKKDKMRYTENWVTTKLEFRIDDISVEFGGHICQQLVLYLKKNTLPMIYIDILGLYIWINHTKTYSHCS